MKQEDIKNMSIFYEQWDKLLVNRQLATGDCKSLVNQSIANCALITHDLEILNPKLLKQL